MPRIEDSDTIEEVNQKLADAYLDLIASTQVDGFSSP